MTDPTDYEARLQAIRDMPVYAESLDAAAAPGALADDLIAEVKRLRAENEALRESLTWCGGSPSFSPGGEAREEWERVVLPLLTRSGA